MTANAYFTFPKVLRRLLEGPLGDYVDLYAAQLLKEGHCYQSGACCIRIVGDFSQWLAYEHVGFTSWMSIAHMALKEAALAKVDPLGCAKIVRYQPGDELLTFLNEL